MSPQDIRHIEWLGETKKAYQTCFPEQDLFVELDYNDEEKTPILLKIYDQNIKEVYEKTYDNMKKKYIDPVFCFLYDDSDAPKRKEMTFESFREW